MVHSWSYTQYSHNPSKITCNLTRFHIHPVNPPISSEKTFKIRLTSTKFQIPTKYRPHDPEGFLQNPYSSFSNILAKIPKERTYNSLHDTQKWFFFLLQIVVSTNAIQVLGRKIKHCIRQLEINIFAPNAVKRKKEVSCWIYKFELR